MSYNNLGINYEARDMNKLINNLIADGVLKTPTIIKAFLEIDRADFLPEELKREAAVNLALPLGWGQTNSQPLTVAFMLELLQPKKRQSILDVGSGSGWTTALLARIVGPKGHVTAIEKLKTLHDFGKSNLESYDFIKKKVVECSCGNGREGFLKNAPYDRILVSAAAKKIPSALKAQLKIGGRMVLPVGHEIWLVEKRGGKDFYKEIYPGFVFVPLV